VHHGEQLGEAFAILDAALDKADEALA